MRLSFPNRARLSQALVAGALPAAVILYVLAVGATEEQGPGETSAWDAVGWVVTIGYPLVWFFALGLYVSVPRIDRRPLRANRWMLAAGLVVPLVLLAAWALFMRWVMSGVE